ncbi:uncharacterized mitochondrial protein-like protein [Tanacetum coccineum]
MGFLQCVLKKAVYRKVPSGEFIIVAVNVDDIFVTGTSLNLINEFKMRMASQFEMSDLGELTYCLGIEVSQRKDCMEIKQEIYAMKILKEAGMKDCNPVLCLMEPGLKLSKAKDEPEVKATQYRKMVSWLHYLLHTHPDLAYSVGVVSQYMQRPRESHARALKQILCYLKGTTSFQIKYKRGDMRLVGYSSHNVDIDDGRSTTAKFMAATTATTCQAIWLKKVLAEVTENEHVIVEHGVIIGELSEFRCGLKHVRRFSNPSMSRSLIVAAAWIKTVKVKRLLLDHTMGVFGNKRFGAFRSKKRCPHVGNMFRITLASYPTPLQDFSVLNFNSKVLVNGVVCKDPKDVKAEDFLFRGLQRMGNTSNHRWCSRCTTVTGLSSQNPGVITIANPVFGSNPDIS